MIKKFKCKKCGHVFEAEESEVKYCPRDLSSDIVPYKSKMPLYICIAALFIGIVCAIIWWPKDSEVCPDCGKNPCECTQPVCPDCGKNPCECTQPVCPDCGKNPCECVVYELLPSKPILKGNVYSYEVKTNPTLPSSGCEYKLYSDEQHTTCAGLCTNGKFDNVEPSANSGIYYLVVYMNKKEVISESVPGFDRPAPPKPAPSVAQLQSWLNNQDPILTTYKDVKIKYNKLASNKREKKTLSDLGDAISMENWDVKVISSNNDSNGHLVVQVEVQ